ETLYASCGCVARRFNVGVVLASVTVGGQEWFRVHVNQPRRALAPGRSLRDWLFIRQVLEGNEAIVVPDVQQHPVFAQTEFPPAGTLRGYAGVPLFATSGRVACALALF